MGERDTSDDTMLEANPPTSSQASSLRIITRAEKLAAERERLITALANGTTDKLLERVASLLSRYPVTRNSDIALQLAYWKEFEPEEFAQLENNPDTLYKLTRLTSLARARAKVQNTFRLFQAKEEIRKRRGTLSEEERERHASEHSPGSTLTVYTDESGKTDPMLVVGSVWFVDPADVLRLPIRVAAWRRQTGFEGEFHFAEVRGHTLSRYQEFVDLILDQAPLISFKSIAIPRTGIRHSDEAFERLYLELLRRGVAHEHSTGRAELPRSLFVVKDQDTPGADRVFLSRLRDQLIMASGQEFRGELRVEALEAVDSRNQPLIQMADLYTSSVNRSLARATKSDKPKDVLADFVLARVASMAGLETDLALIEAGGDSDIHVHIRL